MRLKQATETVGTVGVHGMGECEAPGCVTPTERVWKTGGKRLCKACCWQLLLHVTDPGTSEGQLLMKSPAWRAEIDPTPQQMASFFAEMEKGAVP
jgi:hypothetical protein